MVASDPYQFPKLRWPLDVRIEKVQGQEILLLSCPIGIAKEPLLLVPAVAPILSCFEGALSINQICDKFREYGISPELVQKLVTLLDDHLYLASPRFEAAQRAEIEGFKNSSVRSAALAGLGYPAEAAQLRALVDGYLSAEQPATQGTSTNMIGLVAPHIDYRRGGSCYGRTYRQLAESPHDLFLLIGTSHQYSRRMFHLTAKDFATPLGALACDIPFVQDLASRYGLERRFADEMLHRREHSLELQTPFMKRLNERAAIVPVLVGSFHQMLVSGRMPSEFDEYESFAASLAEVTRTRVQQGAKLCVIAGVDMAHVGRHFGDSDALTPRFMEEIEARDRIYLQTILAQDKRALFTHIAEDQDRRRICGFPTMYLVLDLLDRLGIRYRAELFDYQQAVDYTTDCAVTFAGVGMFEPTSR